MFASGNFRSEVYKENEILYVSVGTKYPSLTESESDMVFRIATRSDEEGAWSAR